MYVTRVINPETEIKKKQQAKELECVLQAQIEAKKRMKEEERRNRITEELREEERWKRERQLEREAMEKEKEREKEKAKKEKEKEKTTEKKPTEEDRTENEPVIQQRRQEPGPDPTITPEQLVSAAPQGHKVEKVDWTAKFRTGQQAPELDLQLKQLHTEMMEKEREFHGELEKLRQVAFDTSNARDATSRQLSQLQATIVTRTHEIASTYRTDPLLRYSLAAVPRAAENKYTASTGMHMGRYSRFYFTDYNKAMGFQAGAKLASRDELATRKRYQPRFGPESFLPGESRMLPWRNRGEAKSKPESKRVAEAGDAGAGRSQNLKKTVCERLDELMNEFLSQKEEEPAEKRGTLHMAAPQDRNEDQDEDSGEDDTSR